MANEIRISLNANCTNGNYTDQIVKSIQVNQTTANGTKPGLTLTTSDTALSFPGIGTFGYAVVYNQDATNYVTFGPQVAGAIAPFLQVGPGEFALLRLTPGITIRAQSHTASVDVSFWLLEN